MRNNPSKFIFVSDLLEVSKSPETLLLCAATSANLTSLPSSNIEASHGLLSSLIRHPASASSVHIQEQVVTVINNVTRGHTSGHVVTSDHQVVSVMAGAVDYLLDLLSLAKLEPSNTETFVTAKRTATKAVIGELQSLQTLIGFVINVISDGIIIRLAQMTFI